MKTGSEEIFFWQTAEPRQTSNGVVALQPPREIMLFAKEKRAEKRPQHLFLKFFFEPEALRSIEPKKIRR